MLFSTITNIFGYNNNIIMYREVSSAHIKNDTRTRQLYFLERVDSDIKLIFSIRRYNMLKSIFPKSKIYLVTNDYNYYLSNRNIPHIRYLPVFVAMTNNKITKDHLNVNDIELSTETFMRIRKKSDLQNVNFEEIVNNNGNICLRSAFLVQFLKDYLLALKLPNVFKLDFNIDSCYRKNLLFLLLENDFVCYSLPVNINIDKAEYYWFKNDNKVNNIIRDHLKYFDLNLDEIDDSADTYYKYTLYNTENLRYNIQKNLRECFKIFSCIEDDIFSDTNTFDEVLEVLKQLNV